MMQYRKFDQSDTEIIGYINTGYRTRASAPLFNTPISIRENLNMLFSGKRPMWIPSGAEFKMFMPRVNPDVRARASATEAYSIPESEFGGADFFGVEWEYSPEAGGSMVRPGKPKVPDICKWEKYITFPNVHSIDWAKNAEENREYLDTPQAISACFLNGGFFERLISFLGFEDAAAALVDEDQQDAVHRLFDRLADFYIELINVYKANYNMDLVHMHDDWGSQRAPFFSEKTARTMIMPYLHRVTDHVHNGGMWFEMHSCGKNEILVPVYIDAGVDTWNGQPINDKEELVSRYGKKFVFSVPYPEINEDASVVEIWKVAREFMEIYASNGGRVIVSGKGQVSDELCKAIYILSRKAYDEENE